MDPNDQLLPPEPPRPDKPVVSVPFGSPGSPAVTPSPRGPWLKRILVGFVILLVLAAIAGIVIILLSHKPKKVAGPPPPKQLCFVRLNYLDCVNQTGSSRVRYNLPSLPQNARTTSLIASADQSQYLAISPNLDGTNSIWAISPTMKIEQEVQLPSGESGVTPSWSRDDKSIFLEVDGASGSRQIEQYTFGNNNPTQLTFSGYNSTPYQTADGHILYGHSANGQTDWLPYVMNSDGTKSQPLGNLAGLSTVSGFSYDALNDTIFVYGTDSSGKPAIVYGPTTDFLQKKQIKELEVPVAAGDQIAYVSASSIVVSNGFMANIYSLSGQTQPTAIMHFGNLVGMLSVQEFQKAAQQTEQTNERIINLSLAPADFVPFIKAQFSSGNQACVANPTAQAEGIDFNLVINQVVNDSYASVTQNCTSSTTIYYAKDSSGNWVEAFTDQGTPNCSQVDAYSFTSQIIPQCYDDNGQNGNKPTNQVVTNPNP